MENDKSTDDGHDEKTIIAEYEISYSELENEAKKATRELTITNPESMTDDETAKLANKIIKRATSLNAVKIDRAVFLRTELKKACPNIDSDLAVEKTPIEAGVDPQTLDKIAASIIDFETKKCAGLSFLAGIPGGVALAGTVPADLAQYFAHVMRVEQKLAYLYGWQTFLNDEDEVDDETVMRLIVLMGVMLQVGGAANTITKFAADVAQKSVQKTIQRKALTKTVWYTPMKNVLRVIGIQLNKEVFSKTLSKAVPVIGGLISGGLTYASFKPGAERLRKYLRELPISGIDPSEPDGASQNVLDEALNTITPIAESAEATVVSVGKQAAETASAGAQAAGNAVQDAFRGVGSFLGGLKKK